MRLFVALLPSEELRRALARQAAAACQLAGGGTPTPARNLHLTLAFLGETDRVEAAKGALQQVKVPAFELAMGREGMFPAKGGGLLWQGVLPSPPLLTLERRLSQALAREGFLPEPRPFVPHITLVRRAPCRQAPLLPPLSCGGCRVESLWLMESILGCGPAAYLPVMEHPLQPR